MSVEDTHSTDSHLHSSDCGCRPAWWRRTLALPLTPLRWLVLGCAGLAVLGAVLPFSPIPPCPLLTMTGVPCPFCGMTRSVRSIARLDVGASLRFQPFGLVALVCGLIILGLWAVPRTRAIAVVRVPLVIVFAALVGSWIWNIGFNPTFT